jgi:exonuclease SbcD
MKILHTADWHIGKKLQKYDLSRDFDLFIDWLCRTIRQESVDVLLVSGDIFDLSNPSSDARTQYYRALMQLRPLNLKIILTGGNHDSPSMLNAPREILRQLDMHIIGGMPQELADVLIPISGKNGATELVIAALPFLRDSDLRSANDGSNYEDRIEAIRKGIQNTFHRAAQLCEQDYPKIPAIAMGHLFAAGMETSESERDIQIGNQAAFEASHFGDYFKYIALGHIHKPQQVKALVPTFYSGSPLPLSFSEREDLKRILIIDNSNVWTPHSIPVPVFRRLIRISGTINKLQQKLEELKAHEELETLVEVELIEEQYDAVKIYDLDKLVVNFEKPGYKIIKHRATFSHRHQDTGDIYSTEQHLEDLKPRDVFVKLIGQHEYDEIDQREILSAFDELLEEVKSEENSIKE